TGLHSARFLPTRSLRPVRRSPRVEAAGGRVLLAAAAAALVWANLPGGESYHRFWETPADFTLGPLALHETLRGLVDHGLMTLFFFVVGLEIKREMVRGELRDFKTAALPILAAVGGMLVPAAVYLGFVGGGEAARGWAVPVATDIAFSLGVLSLLGTRVPVGARLFLLTLAIADDIGGIVIIAAVYTSDLAVWWLVGAIAALAVVWAANRAAVRSLAFYGIAAFAAWLCLLESGVHATLSGVALALLTPATSFYTDEAYRESSFLVVPLFALANSGVRFSGMDLGAAVTHPVTLGTALGLLVGKLVGISAFAWLAVRLGWGRLPREVGWRHVAGVAAVAGIGFTVALFISGLAFSDPHLADQAKLGIYAGSILAGGLGYLVLRTAPAPAAVPEEA
ncbi:MAG: nhaA, partial [Actinobacteria bacterium]|nr:nhaA [Actinomycetota bacterium]